MNTSIVRFTALSLFVLCVWAAPTSAEVTVTVTISGSIDEMLPIIEHLKALGIGVAPAAEAGEGIKLEMHSVAPIQPSAREVAEPVVREVPAPEPAPALLDVAVEPTPVKPGETALVMVRVNDPEREIDTLAATMGKESTDLYDNGTHGDAVARDGVWSRELTVPRLAETGKHEILVTAYGANGEPLVVEGPEGKPAPVTAVGGFLVE